MTVLPAISLWQPWATLIATPACLHCDGSGVIGREMMHSGGDIAEMAVRCGCDGAMVKRFETRSRPCPPKYIGQRVAIHAAKRTPTTRDLHVLCHRWPNISSRPSPSPVGSQPRLPLGAVVATAVITASLPIVSSRTLPMQDHVSIGPSGLLRNHLIGSTLHLSNIDDQLPYGDWTPGRYAWALADVEPVDPPVPATGRQGWFTVELP